MQANINYMRFAVNYYLVLTLCRAFQLILKKLTLS